MFFKRIYGPEEIKKNFVNQIVQTIPTNKEMKLLSDEVSLKLFFTLPHITIVFLFLTILLEWYIHQYDMTKEDFPHFPSYDMFKRACDQLGTYRQVLICI